jgi:proteasome lid subunit RPN8/RPN11
MFFKCFYKMAVVEFGLKEAEEEPELIVIVHTHPAGIAHPSEIDREFCTPATKTIREYVPDAHIIFGIHSLSREEIRERAEPKKQSKNRISWCSITRAHELAFYDEMLMPMVVVLGV